MAIRSFFSLAIFLAFALSLAPRAVAVDSPNDRIGEILVTEGNPQSVSGGLQAYLDSVMMTEPFRSAQVGVLAMTTVGDTIVSYNPLRKLVPASNTKLVTTGLALSRLGASYRFATRIGYAGEIRNGVLHGDLYIIGGGDPTIGARDEIASPADSLFSAWAAMVRNVGIRKIEGSVIGDGSYYDGEYDQPTWEYGDIGTYYGPGSDGLSFYRNRIDLHLRPSDKAGGKVFIESVYPDLPWLSMDNTARTSPAGNKDNVLLYTTTFSDNAVLAGSLPQEGGPYTFKAANKQGARTCAHMFTEYLSRVGIEIKGVTSKGEPASISAANGPASRDVLPAAHSANRPIAGQGRTGVHIIGETYSPALLQIARMTNKVSDNFYAEALFRALSKQSTFSASYDSCAVAAVRCLEAMFASNRSRVAPASGLGRRTSHLPVGFRMVDGSGLSRHNYMSPSFFCDFLSAMWTAPCRDAYISTINMPGNEGMKYRLKAFPLSVRERVRMKSGSMDGVICYSGYVLPPSIPYTCPSESSAHRPAASQSADTPAIVFSIMVNNCPDSASAVNRIIDTLVASLCHVQ